MTRIPYGELAAYPDAVVATYLDVLEERTKAEQKAVRRGRR